MHVRCRITAETTADPHLYKGGTKYVEFSSTRQPLLAPSANRLEVLGEAFFIYLFVFWGGRTTRGTGIARRELQAVFISRRGFSAGVALLAL